MQKADILKRFWYNNPLIKVYTKLAIRSEEMVENRPAFCSTLVISKSKANFPIRERPPMTIEK